MLTHSEQLEFLKQAASKGAKKLDEVRPGWEAEVDQERLDIGSCHDCVLGQLYGGDDIGTAKVFRVYGYQIQVENGFYLCDDGHRFPSFSEPELRRPLWLALGEFWKNEINARLTKQA